jgi:hypothetical protein
MGERMRVGQRPAPPATTRRQESATTVENGWRVPLRPPLPGRRHSGAAQSEPQGLRGSASQRPSARREEEPAVGLRLPTTGSKREETVAAAPTLLLDAQGRSRRFGCLPQPGERVKEQEEPLDG